MKTYQFADRTILCGHAGQWEELVRAGDEAQMGTVLDLRTFLEIAEQPVPKPPEGWGYRRLPLTGATVSEQDLDVFRREFYRKPRTVVVGPNETRGELMVAASVARLEQKGWDYARRAEGVEPEERELLHWLTSYLVRHGCEPSSSLEAMASAPPAATKKKPSKASEVETVAEPAAEAPQQAPGEPGAEAVADLPSQGEQLEALAGVDPKEQIQALEATAEAGPQSQENSSAKASKKSKAGSKSSAKAKGSKRKS